MKRRLIVNWQHEASRQLHAVAQLVVSDREAGYLYEFAYLRGAVDARRLGFRPFVAFRDMDRRYVSRDEMFAFFKNRVLPSTRPDYLEYVESLGLTPETANAVDLLGRSAGRRQTDRIETVLAPERDLVTGLYTTHFLLRGVRHVDGGEDAVAGARPDDSLSLSLEPNNPRNPRARKVAYAGSPVGYVPDYLVDDLDELERRGAQPTLTVVRLNPRPAPSHHRLLVRLEATWPDGFESLASPRFEPLPDAPMADVAASPTLPA